MEKVPRVGYIGGVLVNYEGRVVESCSKEISVQEEMNQYEGMLVTDATLGFLFKYMKMKDRLASGSRHGTRFDVYDRLHNETLSWKLHRNSEGLLVLDWGTFLTDHNMGRDSVVVFTRLSRTPKKMLVHISKLYEKNLPRQAGHKPMIFKSKSLEEVVAAENSAVAEESAGVRGVDFAVMERAAVSEVDEFTASRNLSVGGVDLQRGGTSVHFGADYAGLSSLGISSGGSAGFADMTGGADEFAEVSSAINRDAGAIEYADPSRATSAREIARFTSAVAEENAEGFRGAGFAVMESAAGGEVDEFTAVLDLSLGGVSDLQRGGTADRFGADFDGLPSHGISSGTANHFGADIADLPSLGISSLCSADFAGMTGGADEFAEVSSAINRNTAATESADLSRANSAGEIAIFTSAVAEGSAEGFRGAGFAVMERGEGGEV